MPFMNILWMMLEKTGETLAFNSGTREEWIEYKPALVVFNDDMTDNMTNLTTIWQIELQR